MLGDGGVVQARRLLLATGVVDELPPIPGLAELWGTAVFHCPYCHGWEVRDQPLAVLGNGSMGVEQALLISQWSRDLVLCTHGSAGLTDHERSRLAARDIRVREGRITRVEGGEERQRPRAVGPRDGHEQHHAHPALSHEPRVVPGPPLAMIPV